jgi:hypothetical protein
MSLMSPKPIIAHVHRTWRVPPGMTYAVVEDVESRVWVVESCPAGTHFWTVDQTLRLPQGAKTRRVLQEVIREGRRREEKLWPQTPASRPLVRERVATKSETHASPTRQREVHIAPIRSEKTRSKTLMGV